MVSELINRNVVERTTNIGAERGERELSDNERQYKETTSDEPLPLTLLLQVPSRRKVIDWARKEDPSEYDESDGYSKSSLADKVGISISGLLGNEKWMRFGGEEVELNNIEMLVYFGVLEKLDVDPHPKFRPNFESGVLRMFNDLNATLGKQKDTENPLSTLFEKGERRVLVEWVIERANADDFEPTPQSEIGEEVGVVRSIVSANIGVLHEFGLVELNEANRRKEYAPNEDSEALFMLIQANQFLYDLVTY